MLTAHSLQVAGVITGMVLVVALLVRAQLDTGEVERLFTLEQERVVARAFGPHCIWRPYHLPQAVGAFLVLGEDPPKGSPLWITGLTLALLAGTGLPMVRQVSFRCSEPIARGHQWPAAGDRALPFGPKGSTKITNLELVCTRHNEAQSNRWSWRWAFAQWPPMTPLVYGARLLVGTVGLYFLLATDRRAREDAQV